MAPGVAKVGVGAAARSLLVSETTIRNWCGQGRIAAERGSQRQRPRWAIWVNRDGAPVDWDGNALTRSTATSGMQLALEERVAALERSTHRTPAGGGSDRFRDAALQLQATMERQRRAMELQVQASSELNAALTEQAQIITGLLIGDPIAEVQFSSTDPLPQAPRNRRR